MHWLIPDVHATIKETKQSPTDDADYHRLVFNYIGSCAHTSVKESKETIVSESVGRLEKKTLPDIQPSEEKVSASFSQTTFQTLKQDMKRILQRKIF